MFYASSAMWIEWRIREFLRVSIRESTGSCSVGRTRKRWVDTVKEKRGMDVRQARRMVQDRSEWQWFVRGMHGEYPGV